MKSCAPSDSANTIIDVLRARADSRPDGTAFAFLTGDDVDGPHLTYAGLDRQARIVAANLRDATQLGDRALLMYAPGLEFIPAFFGCLYAGVVPVPVSPPRIDRWEQGRESLVNIATDCAPKVVLTTSALAGLFK